MKITQTLTAGLLLSACSYLPINTLRQLTQLDPMIADPASIAVRFDLPQGLDIPEGSAKLSLDVKHNTGDEMLEVYVLDRTAQGNNVIFRIAQDDLERLRAQQSAAQKWGEDESEGSLTIGIDDLCTIGAGPTEDARISNMISLDGGETFLPLVTDYPLSDILEEGEFAKMPPC